MATLCFDFDGTLCTNTNGDYDRARPFPWAIARVNRLAAEGHRIIIFTARGTATGIDWSEVTRRQLQEWGVRYDALHFGKPSAAVYIDDRAVHTEAWRRGSGFGPPGLPVVQGEDEVLPTVLPPSASSLVEVSRTFGGRPLRLEDRVRRLLVRAGRAGIAQLPSAAEVEATVTESLAELVEEDVVYSICVGDPAQFADLEALASGGSPRLSVSCRPLAELQPALASMTVEPGQDGRPPLVRAEPAGADAGPSPSAWPLHADPAGRLSAGLGARLGVVDAERGALTLEPHRGEPDIATVWLSELAIVEGLSVEEAPLTAADLGRTEAALLVGEPYCLMIIQPPGSTPQGRAADMLHGLWAAWEREAGADLALAAYAGTDLLTSAGPPGHPE